MQKNIIVFLFVVHALLWADTSTDDSHADSPASTKKDQAATTVIEGGPYEACVESICGKPSHFNNPLCEPNGKIFNDMPASAREAITSGLKNALSDELENIEALKTYVQKLKQDKTFGFTQEMLAYAAYFRTFTKVSELVTKYPGIFDLSILTNGKTIIHFDQALIAKARKENPEYDSDQFWKVLKIVAASESMQTLFATDEIPISSGNYYRWFYQDPTMTLGLALRKRMSETEEQIKQLRNLLPPDKINDMENDVLKSYKRINDPYADKETALASFEQNAANISSTLYLLTSSSLKTFSDPKTLEALQLNHVDADQVLKRLQIQEDLIKTNQEKFDEDMQGKLDLLAQNYFSLPSKDATKMGISTAQTWVSDFQKSLKSIMPDDAIKSLGLSSIPIANPLNRDGYINERLHNLNDKDLKKQADFDDQSKLFSIAEDLTDDDNSPIAAPDVISLLNDEFVIDELRIGPISSLNPQFGKGIFFHELGHALSKKLNEGMSPEVSEKVAQIRSCLTKWHSSDKYLEEDWADHLSAMALSPADANYGCILVAKNKKAYVNLSLENPDPSDTHSANLFRLLHIEEIKNGKLPDACEKALASQGATDIWKCN